MAEQLSLFGSPEPEEAPKSATPAAAPAQPEPVPEPVVAYASVVLDIPTRALSEPFAYGIPGSLANEAQVGSTVLVHFGNRAAAGYIVDIAPELADLQGNEALDPARIKAIEAILSKPLFTAEAARIARWMSREYVATLSECLRLFLPPGGSSRVVKGDDGVWTVERPAVKPIQNRWVMLTPEGFDYTPPKTAVRQRQLIEALQCGPVTTRDLNLLYNSMSATIKALEKRGVVVVEERRAWRGCSEQTTLSSASGKAPVALTNGQQQALAQIERARLDAHGDVVLVDGVTGSGKTEVFSRQPRPVRNTVDGRLGTRGRAPRKGRAVAQPPWLCAVLDVPRVRMRPHLQSLLHRAYVSRAHAHAAVSHMRFVLARAAVSRAHEPLPQMWQSLPSKNGSGHSADRGRTAPDAS